MIFVTLPPTGWHETRALPLADVQWVLGHAHLSTTQLYLTPMPGDVIAGVLAHHRRRQPMAIADAATGDAATRRAAIGGTRWTCCSVGRRS